MSALADLIAIGSVVEYSSAVRQTAPWHVLQLAALATKRAKIESGRSSVVEHLLPKQRAVGSSPIARSISPEPPRRAGDETRLLVNYLARLQILDLIAR